MLGEPDARGDTPLHRSARYGQALSCRTLLRLGVDPGCQNKWLLWPEDLAALEGHKDIAAVIRGVRLRSNVPSTASEELKANSAWRAVIRHPDGLGALAARSPSVPFNGIVPSDSLRHAVNHAAGLIVLPRSLPRKTNDQHLPSASAQDSDTETVAELALDHVRTALLGTGFELEAEVMSSEKLCSGGIGWGPRDDGAMVCGLLAFEAPGHVSSDAQGHWIALRAIASPRMTPPVQLGNAEPAGVLPPSGGDFFHILVGGRDCEIITQAMSARRGRSSVSSVRLRPWTFLAYYRRARCTGEALQGMEDNALTQCPFVRLRYASRW